MTYRKLSTVKASLVRSIKRSNDLMEFALNIDTSIQKGELNEYRDSLVEIAFLRAYGAWEEFLERAFILYMYMKKFDRRLKLKRYVNPPTIKIAKNLLITEGKRYVDWTDSSTIVLRAKRFFEDGEPFSTALKEHQTNFEKLNTLRNAIAHSSEFAQSKFESVARNELRYYPSELTIGGFLLNKKSKSARGQTYFKYFLGNLRKAADIIIPE